MTLIEHNVDSDSGPASPGVFHHLPKPKGRQQLHLSFYGSNRSTPNLTLSSFVIAASIKCDWRRWETNALYKLPVLACDPAGATPTPTWSHLTSFITVFSFARRVSSPLRMAFALSSLRDRVQITGRFPSLRSFALVRKSLKKIELRATYPEEMKRVGCFGEREGKPEEMGAF